MLRSSLILIAAFALSGCLSQSQIQGKYMASQTDCRNQTAKLFADGKTAANSEQGQAAIASGFSDCMNREGWHFTTAKPVAVASNPPTGSPSTNPSAAYSSTFYKGVPAPAAAPATTGSTFYNGVPAGATGAAATGSTFYNTAPQAQTIYPPSGAPSVNPSAAAVRAVPPQNPPTNPVPAGRIVEANPPTQSPAVQPGPAPAKVAPAPSAGTAPLETYQPARVDSALPSDYSAGGGRTF